MRAIAAVIFAIGVATTGWAAPARHTVLEFSDLNGWAADDHAAALDVFLSTCRDMRPPDWRSLCSLGEMQSDPRLFFESFFRPVLIEDGARTLFTAYYEPQLNGSRYRGGPYQYPIYALPPEAEGTPFAPRAEIEEDQLLEGRGLEIAWVDDPVDAYFLQVQGSGRVMLDDGTALRVGYAGKNGHEYRSIGEELVRRGLYEPHEVSAATIRHWVSENGEEGRRLLHHNPSYVFFREVSHVPAHKGPLGAMNRSITAGRSLAIDPEFVSLGSPVWIETKGADPWHRLMVAQDTGSVIKGAQRADIFMGFGDEAGREAARIKDDGRMLVLMPIGRAFASAEAL